MAILEKEALVKYNAKTIMHYESLGYKFPRYKDKSGILRIKRGTDILVQLKDLTEGSNVRVTKICDVCGKHVNNQKYCIILLNRQNNEKGIDKCLECMSIEKGKNRGIANENNCIAAVDGEFAKLFWNEEDTYKFTCNSGKKSDFKCPDCGNKIEKRIITNVFRQGLFCQYCNDGISYPEKFMLSLLTQLQIKFNYQKLFNEWFKNEMRRYYDFYIPSMKSIIEVHGMQHYEKGFERYGENARTVEEEKENDIYKMEIALKSGISKDNYIIIDARYSNLEYIRSSIINSNISRILDLSKVNWMLCHEDACKSIVEKVCSMWKEKSNVTDISREIQLDRATVRKYLKQGSKIGWCDYNSDNTKKKPKAVVQLSLQGEFIKEFPTLLEASKEMGSTTGTIGNACKNNWKSHGFKWMLKDDYEKLMTEVKE